MISFLAMTYYLNEKYSLTHLNYNRKLRLKSIEKFVIKPDMNRLNNLFDLLTIKEAHHQNILERLNLLSFKKLANGIISNEYYQNEIKEYLDLNENNVKANNKFIKYLNNISEYYSFKWNKKNQIDSSIDESRMPKPVFVTAANKKYFEPLKEIIENIKFYYPHFIIYVYILNDMNESMIKNLKNICNNEQCKIIKFDSDNRYKNKSPHVSNLVTYSWKPLIIQVC
jgi:hypothetical protein